MGVYSRRERKFGKAALRVSAIYSPDDLGAARRSLYLEAGPSFDIDDTTRLSANMVGEAA